MKKVVIISLGLLVAGSGMAQPAITYAKHGLQVGDVHQTRMVTTVEPGESGANVTWDFSACEVTGNIHSEALESGSNGHIAVRNDGNVLFQFDVTPYGNDYYGYATQNFSVAYEKPVLKTRYPFGFLDQHSGNFLGYITQGDRKIPVDGFYSSEVDGYGAIKLPNGVTLNNVLRVKTTETQKFQQSGSSYDITEEKYLWYSQDFRYPVFVVIQHGNNANGTANVVSKSTYVSVAALSAPAVVAADEGSAAKYEPQAEELPALPEVEYSIYPNPVATAANITYTLPSDAKVIVAVYTAAGVCVRKLVNNELQSAGVYTYTYTPSAPGTYFVRFAFGDKTYTEQIVKK